MRSKFVLIAVLGIIGVLIVAPATWAQLSKAGHAPETPAPQVKPGTWRGVSPVVPCVLRWDGIYSCPPAPTAIAIRAGRIVDSVSGKMLTKHVMLIQGHPITHVRSDCSI